MQIDPNYHIYPTRLSQFRFYPRRWAIEQLHVVPEQEKNVAAKIGTLVHKICESFYSEINPELSSSNPESHFLDVVRMLRESKWDYSIPIDKVPEVDEMLRNFALNAAFNYRNTPDKNNFYPIACEKELISSKLPIAAIIDKINKSFTCLDYKSSKEFPEILFQNPKELNPDDKFKYDYNYESLLCQAVFAALLIEEHYGTLPRRFIFVYLRHLNLDATRGILDITITPEKISLVKSWIAQMLSDVQTDNIPSCTKRNKKACYMFNTPCAYKNFCDSSQLCIYAI